MIITLSDNGFDTMDPIYIETGLGIVIAMCLAIAVALVILVVWLSRPNRKPTKTVNHGRHDAATGTSVWHERIDDVVTRRQRRSYEGERVRSACGHRKGFCIRSHRQRCAQPNAHRY